MNDKELLRLIKLARKTGDTLIVTDPNGQGAMAIMDVLRYEALVDSGFDELIEEEPIDLDFDESTPLEIMAPEDADEIHTEIPESVENEPIVETEPGAEEEERFYLEPIE